MLGRWGSPSVGRPHIAAALIKGWRPGPQEAFDRFLADGGPARGPLPIETGAAVDLVHAADGVAVIRTLGSGSRARAAAGVACITCS